MNPIRIAIERPIAVVAAVLIAVLFGALSLARIPIQLTPDVRAPVIEISTIWPGAAPAEVEREIVNPQEEELKGLEGLETMTSTSETGSAQITLEFAIGTDMNRALLLVANRLDRVTDYPDEASEPTLDTSGADDSPIAWIVIQRIDGNDRDISEYGDFVEDVVRERIERVDGVSLVNVFGGASRELQIVVDPERLAEFGLTIPEVVGSLRGASIAVSAGDIEEGKRRYVVRAEGRLNTITAIGDVVLRSGAADGGGRVFVRDVADVRFGFEEPTARIRRQGEPALAINVIRETGANVIETMEGVRAALAELQERDLPDQGLVLDQVYDETIYIDGAIDLVITNIWVGGVLAAAVLMLFLRSPRATLIVSLAIPVSIVASFVAMAALGRTLNVISLAGIAFAVGMVVDAAIVVLENIFRLRQAGKSPAEAAYEGARQVWGAILVSALTTVLVFAPILVMELEAGQLFRDIAVAISVSVLLSLVVAVTVIPALASRLLTGGRNQARLAVTPIPGVDHLGRAFSGLISGYARATVRSRILGGLTVVAITVGALAGARAFLPQLEYLPEGNRNLVFGIILPPPGYNLDTTTGIAERIESAARPLWEQEESGDPEQPPAIENFFFVALSGQSFLGASAQDGDRVRDLIPFLQGPIFTEPGTFGFVTQPSLFGRGIGGGNAISLDISGQNLEDIIAVAQQAAGMTVGALPPQQGNQFRPIPGLELGAPEVRVTPDRIRLADAGVDAATLALTLDAYNDGVRVRTETVGSERIDLVLMGEAAGLDGGRTQDIGAYPVVTPSGRIIPLSELSTPALTAGPVEIRHRERLRTITLEIRPGPGVALETALDTLREQVIAPLEAQGLPDGVRLSLSGAADDLDATWNALQINLLVALIIVFLVMAVLFESFVLPLVILVSVPVAAAGGVAGLALLNVYQPQSLDMLTMLGFVILVGIVVNNAILLVHQTLLHQREDGMDVDAAIHEATRNRIRPIFMSSLTSIFGMLPLVVFPGPGSELYRGLGSVVVGGLTLSALLTLLLVPPLLKMTLRSTPRGRAFEPPREPVAAPAE